MLCRPEQHTASHIQEQHQVFFTVLAQEQNKNTKHSATRNHGDLEDQPGLEVKGCAQTTRLQQQNISF
jgi:hypothetical protein